MSEYTDSRTRLELTGYLRYLMTSVVGVVLVIALGDTIRTDPKLIVSNHETS